MIQRKYSIFLEQDFSDLFTVMEKINSISYVTFCSRTGAEKVNIFHPETYHCSMSYSDIHTGSRTDISRTPNASSENGNFKN